MPRGLPDVARPGGAGARPASLGRVTILLRRDGRDGSRARRESPEDVRAARAKSSGVVRGGSPPSRSGFRAGLYESRLKTEASASGGRQPKAEAPVAAWTSISAR